MKFLSVIVWIVIQTVVFKINVQNWPFMFSFKWSEDAFVIEGCGLLIIVLIYWAIGIVCLRRKTAELDLMDCGRRRK